MRQYGAWSVSNEHFICRDAFLKSHLSMIYKGMSILCMFHIMFILGISHDMCVILWESFTVAGDSVLDYQKCVILQSLALFSVDVKCSSS